MNLGDWKILADVTFKTQSYRKNFDMINEDENFITECDGAISHLRIEKQKPPVFIGEYGFSIWNIALGNRFKVNFKKLLKSHSFEASYSEFHKLTKSKLININDYDKIILVHSLILRSDYRKRGIVEEFVEMLYRDFYGDKIAIFALVKPFQDNPIDMDYYVNQKSIPVRENLGNIYDIVNVSALSYYSLDELVNKKDTEMNEYKLFSVASRCGFTRIGESYIFQFSPEKIVERMEAKFENIKLKEII
jgi:hypothetical protein